MTITKNKPPSVAQAKKLASYWSDGGDIRISESYVDPTDAVLIRKGWITPTGAAGIYPQTRVEFLVYQIAADGMAAMADYFINQAHR